MPNSPLVIFSHGKETGPWGSKIRRLADVARSSGWRAISVDYTALTGQPDAPAGLRLQALLQLLATGLPPHCQLALVGSSMGGWVSAQARLPCPASGFVFVGTCFGHRQLPQPVARC